MQYVEITAYIYSFIKEENGTIKVVDLNLVKETEKMLIFNNSPHYNNNVRKAQVGEVRVTSSSYASIIIDKEHTNVGIAKLLLHLERSHEDKMNSVRQLENCIVTAKHLLGLEVRR